MKNCLNAEEKIIMFKDHLFAMEKSIATIEKYLRDCRKFLEYIGENELSKEIVIAFKNQLIADGYAVASVNSMIASVNSYLEFIEHSELRVKSIKCQRKLYMSEEKELTKDEYFRLLKAAGNNTRLNLILQTICGTGIRVSELKYITVEAVKKGETTVYCKGKNRVILIPGQLRKVLSRYIRRNHITAGSVFISKSGQPLDRCYIWKIMKKLYKIAGVSAEKIFPHNLRKLFARTFYTRAKDIAKLADVLGHSNITTTRIYIMTTGKEHRQRIEQLGLIV